MTQTSHTPHQIRERLIAVAQEIGIDGIGFAPVCDQSDDRERLLDWLARGFHAGMDWMKRNAERRADIQRVLPNAATVISIAVNYNTGHAPCDDCGAFKVSRYAWGEDYHDVLMRKLALLEEAIREMASNAECRSYVDTGPVMEKVWAQRAGLGWIGKNTNLLTRRHGSWVFLGELITTLSLPGDQPHTDFCGSCTRCIDACPTDAFPEPYVLDSSRCISYWTIEHRGEFPDGISENFDGWVFGCDVCQDVCPWNRFGQPTAEDSFAPRMDALCVPDERWVKLSEEEFRKEFDNSAIRRTGREGLARNILSQRPDPLESVLKVIEWQPPEDLEDITLDELER